MARYYRTRRYRRTGNELQEAVIILAILVTVATYTSFNAYVNSHPYVVPLAISLAVIFVVLLAWWWWRRRQRAKHTYEAYTLADIDSMDGLEFEKYLADLFRRQGYTDVRLTEKYDLGIDIIAHKDGTTWGIQAKRYTGLVKAAAVRQAYTALARYKCDRAMVVSNSIYSRPARLLAQDTHSVLVDREALSRWIYEASAK